MRTSLVLSLLLHVVVLSAVLLNFSAKTHDATPKPLSVELINPSDLSQQSAGKKDAPEAEASRAAPPPDKKAETPVKAPEPKAVEKPAETVAAPPPPKPKSEPPKPAEAEAKPQPQPEKAEAKPEPPKPEKIAEAKPKPKPEPKPDPKPERAPRKFSDQVADALRHPAEQERKAQPAPPVETKREFDPDRISALLNRDPKAGAPSAQEGPKEPWRPARSLQDQAVGMDAPAAPAQDVRGVPGGLDARLSSNEIDAFRAQISRCWAPPVGGLGGEAIIVKLRIELNRDGTLTRAPQLANATSSPFFTAAADSATRAVLQCQPYSMPAEKYSQWRDMLLNFDPRRMYGG